VSGPLEGLRVVDCSSGLAGTRASGLLADCGADVIWVEPPGGDPQRETLAVAYAVFNRGKRSIAIDPRDAAERELLHALVASADVLLRTDDPGGTRWPGLEWERVHAAAPALVHVSISGFGSEGPLAGLPAHEALVHALVGTMGEQAGHRDGPIFEGLPFAGIGAAYLALIGALAALYRRGIDGAGRRVETSLYDGALAYLSMLWGDWDAKLPRPAPGTSRVVANSYRCADDEYLGLHTGAVGGFGRLMALLGLADRIPSSPDGRDMGIPLTPEQKELLAAELPRQLASQPRALWTRRLLAADLCAVPHLRPGEVLDAPQARHNGMVLALDDPKLGRIEQVGPVLRFDATPLEVCRCAPRAGEHRDPIVAELEALATRPWPAAREPDAARPLLDGVRILDLGAFYAGPYSSRLLAELGADVIKLEPVAGDPMRGLRHVFRSAQLGKRSLAVDLKAPELDAARTALARWADVVHHNMRPGAAERLGMGDAQLRALNPALVYLHAPGWGSSGPAHARQSFAPLLSGYVGAGFESAGRFNPPLFPVGNEDPGNGLVGAIAILMALLWRQHTGLGQRIENPQLNAAMAHMAHVVRRHDGEVLGAGRLDPLQMGVGPLERLYATRDGWLCLVAQSDAEIDALGRALGVDLLADPRFATRESRDVHEYALTSLLGELFEKRATADWLDALHTAGAPAAEPAPRNDANFLRDPQNQRSGRALEFEHPVEGRVRQVGSLLRVSDCAAVPARLSPELGEHSEAILAWLGYSAAAIARLRERGSLRQSPRAGA
jgi:crotonobetainyl-CoA:carnitine CoA-transferase CaiB-like acyl-CoA transferase